MTTTILHGGLIIRYPVAHAPHCPDVPAEIVDEKMVPRVMRTEYTTRANLHDFINRPGAMLEYTEAWIMTPVGELRVKVEGYRCERVHYQNLVERAMQLAWMKFTNCPWSNIHAHTDMLIFATLAKDQIH